MPDNLKAGVTDLCRYEPGIIELRSAKGVRSYQEFAEHYGGAILPVRPKKPRDKAKVEKAVQEVERQILAPLRHEQFTNFTALNAAIAQGLKRLHDQVMHGYGLSRQGLFAQVDQSALKPLPTLPFVFGHWKSAKVNVDYHIEVEHHYYSVPYSLVTQDVQVKVSEQLVEVFHQHQRIAAHERSRSRHRHTTVAEHMPPEHLAYKQQSKERFLVWAEHLEPHTKAQVQAIFDSKAHEEQAFRSLKGLQRLAQRYPSTRLESACRRANAFDLVGMRRLRTILETQLDQAPLPESTPPIPVTQHPKDNV